MRWNLLVDELAEDLRNGFRQIARNSGFTAIAVLTLALGIGANTALFSIFNSLIVAELNLQPGGGPPQERGARVERLRDATVAVPGVRSAAVSSVRLLTGGGTSTGMVAIGDGPMSRIRPTLWLNGTTPGWFATMGIRCGAAGTSGRRSRGQRSGCDRERNVRAPVFAGRTADRATRAPGIRARHALRDRRRGRRYRLHDAARGHAGNDVCAHGAAQPI